MAMLRRNRRKQTVAGAISKACELKIFWAQLPRGLDDGYSAHSMRATFITTALENGAQLTSNK